MDSSHFEKMNDDIKLFLG